MNTTNLDIKTALVATLIAVIAGAFVLNLMGIQIVDKVQDTAQLIVGR